MRKKFPVKRVLQSGPNGPMWNLLRDGITQSAMATYSVCPKKAKYKLIDGLEAGHYNPALDFGSLFHDILDKVYTQRMSDLNHPAYTKKYTIKELLRKPYSWEQVVADNLDFKRREVIAQHLDPKDEQEFERLLGMCSVVLPRYFDRWRREDSKYHWIAVEEVFEFPYKLNLLTTITVRGKWDGLIMDENGDIWLLETKTKKEIETNGLVSCQAILEKMGYELQIMVYCLAIYHRFGKWPKGVIYNLVKRPGQEYKGIFNRKPENLPQYFQRIEKDMQAKGDAYFIRYTVSLYPEEIEQYRDEDLADLMYRMYDWWNRDGKPSQRVSGACSMYRKPCEFLPLCSGEHNAISAYTLREHTFPELVMVED